MPVLSTWQRFKKVLKNIILAFGPFPLFLVCVCVLVLSVCVCVHVCTAEAGKLMLYCLIRILDVSQVS